MSPGDARKLAESWVVSMRSARRSPLTIKTYTAGLETYIRWCEARGQDVELTRRQVEAFTADLHASGAEAATVLSRMKGVKRFAAWCAAEGEIYGNELAGMRYPRLDSKIPPYLEPAQFAALLATCASRTFTDVRDAAILMLMRDSAVRSAEVLSMTVDGVNVKDATARVERGKGGAGRVVAFSAATAEAIDRYARARRRHPMAGRTAAFWLLSRRPNAGRSPALNYDGMYHSLRRRAEACGFRLHPHMLRSTAAIEMRELGISDAALLALAGWKDVSMLRRYTKAADNRLAVEEAHRLFKERDKRT